MTLYEQYNRITDAVNAVHTSVNRYSMYIGLPERDETSADDLTYCAYENVHHRGL